MATFLFFPILLIEPLKKLYKEKIFMIRFIDLNGTYEYRWEFIDKEPGFHNDYYNVTRYNTCSLTGCELIEWLQKYGYEPDKMFKDTKVEYTGSHEATAEVDKYKLFKKAEEWAESNQETISKNPWTCIGMNGGYVLMSNGSKENTVELGSAAARSNININNSNNVENNVKAAACASLL